jgi:hypothetical protein
MTTLYFICPVCRQNRFTHEICCGSWPLAADLDDQSIAALVALLCIDVIHRLITALPPDANSRST